MVAGRMRQYSSNKTLQSPDFSTEYNPQVVFLKKFEEPLAPRQLQRAVETTCTDVRWLATCGKSYGGGVSRWVEV
ncbi:hypothetical protein Pan258_30200 [Symmachiella dynata]|nr:hypothetical protein Pan258_30200 [Symmachiella dynata]